MAGIYLHVPFCKQKCTYCDFHFSTTYAGYRNKMIAALKKEIETRTNYLNGEQIETIYFGGGTPSLLTEEELKSLVDAIYENYDVQSEIEFTLEANPDDISSEQLAAWKRVGVNRLSIGIQSFYQADLDWMNRAHSVEEGRNALRLAKEEGFFITADLIYGLPNHTLKELDFNIQEMLKLSPDHISAYCLTVEKGTGLHHLINTMQLPSVGEDEQADEFEFLVTSLLKAGYDQYEISNYAKKDAYSKHNTNYWLGVKYLGIGPSAHSFNGEGRRWNVANNTLYIKALQNSESYWEEEILSPSDRFNELILTGLRTKWGVDLFVLYGIKPETSRFRKQLDKFIQNDLLREENACVFLTKKGKLQADFIASELFAEED